MEYVGVYLDDECVLFGCEKNLFKMAGNCAVPVKAISQFTHATDDLQKNERTKETKIWTKFLGKEDGDLESFMHLEAYQRKKNELKQMMISKCRVSDPDWVKYQVEARKRRQEG